MDLEETLKVERYRFVTDRQKYFTELARDAFASYARFLTGLVVGGIALVSSRNKLELRLEVVLYLVHGIVYLVTFLGFVASAQIIFCLFKWWGFRRAEGEINPDCPKMSWWSWLFEALYIVAISVTVLAAWHVASQLPSLLQD